MFDVITIGSAARDIFLLTKRARIIQDDTTIEGKLLAFPLGAKVSIENTFVSDGGGACNAATSFARLGLRVAPHLNVGRDEMGERIIAELQQEGADTSLINKDETLRTGTAIVIVPEGVGDRTVLFYSGANRNLRVTDWERLRPTRWLYVSPVTREAPELLLNLAEFARENGIRLANNPGLGQIEMGYKYMSPILKALDVLIVNRTEAILLLHSKDPSIEIGDNRSLVSELIKMGPKTVVLTCGGEGSCAGAGGEIYFQEALSADVVDVTGAGDAYGSTFVAATIMGHDIQTAMYMAAVNSASVVSKISSQAGLLRLDEIERRMQD